MSDNPQSQEPRPKMTHDFMETVSYLILKLGPQATLADGLAHVLGLDVKKSLAPTIVSIVDRIEAETPEVTDD